MALVRKEEGAKETGAGGLSRGGEPPLRKWQLWGCVSVSMGLCYPQNVCVLEGQRDRLESGPEEVLRRHSKPDTSLGPADLGLSPQNMGVLTGGPGFFFCLLCWKVYGREGDISPLHSIPPPLPPKHDHLISHIKPCCPHFPPPLTSPGRKSAPHPQPRVPEAIYKRQELKGTAQPSWQKHLWV